MPDPLFSGRRPQGEYYVKPPVIPTDPGVETIEERIRRMQEEALQQQPEPHPSPYRAVSPRDSMQQYPGYNRLYSDKEEADARAVAQAFIDENYGTGSENYKLLMEELGLDPSTTSPSKAQTVLMNSLRAMGEGTRPRASAGAFAAARQWAIKRSQATEGFHQPVSGQQDHGVMRGVGDMLRGRSQQRWQSQEDFKKRRLMNAITGGYHSDVGPAGGGLRTEEHPLYGFGASPGWGPTYEDLMEIIAADPELDTVKKPAPVRSYKYGN